MKRFSIFISMCLFLLSACNLPLITLEIEPVTPKPQSELSESRLFNAIQINRDMDEVDVTLEAELVGVSEYLAIYAKQGSRMSDTDIKYLMDEFDAIYPKLIDIYGIHSDIDNNNKVILLLYDINKDFVSGGYVAGFFNPVDLYPQYSESNDAEILYVEGNISGSRYNIYTTLIHEFQHLINTSVTLSTGKRSDLWLNEALSESTEIIYAKAMSANRLNVYNGYSHEYITRGNNFYFWNDADDVLSNYSTASLFMYWLYLHGGEQIIEDIARSQYGNYRAIEDAVKASNSSYLNSLSSWEEVVFAWYEANENYTTGYKNAIVSQNVGNSFNLTSKINKNYGASALLNVGSVILTESEVTINNIDIVQDSFTKGGKTVHLTMNNQKTATDSATIRVSIPASKAPSARSALQDFVPLYDDGGYNIIHIPQSSFDIEALEQ